MSNDEFAAQIDFLIEIDKLKRVLRQTPLSDDSRRENSAEHSWHLAVMAMLLADHAPQPVDLPRVMELVLVHDIVEIDAGDTFCYDEAGYLDKAAREQAAAERIFGILPDAQADRCMALWREFEAGESAEAQFATALDRLQPMLLNWRSGGGSWRNHDVREAQVQARQSPIRDALPVAWPMVQETIAEAMALGLIRPDEELLPDGIDPQAYLNSDPGFMPYYDRYQPDLERIRQIEALQPRADLLIFSEAWCGDCRRNVPRWTRLVEELPQWRNRVLPREAPHSTRYQIVRIPTFVLLDPDSGAEMGRIVENPQQSLEADSLAILQRYHGLTGRNA
ncbi:MAG: HD domain-containing protein [Anaerolineales bacterium]|nr:HD domain-containing protein [Anaerolineales bacterium]MCB9128629.1 HD domain-containing protein [Ardenticatenales bacterium]